MCEREGWGGERECPQNPAGGPGYLGAGVLCIYELPRVGAQIQTLVL